MENKHLRVVIVGGSLAGLMHGILLKRLGHTVIILEQDQGSNREGQAAGIVTLEHSRRFLTTYDLLQSQPYAVPVNGVQSLNKDLKLLSSFDRTMRMSSWNVLYNRLRANFDGLTNEHNPVAPEEPDGVGEAVYAQGRKVVDVQYDRAGGKVKVGFEDLSKSTPEAKSIEADLVIAADGSTSVMRRLLQPELEHSYVGYVAWRGTVLESEVSESTIKLLNQKTTLCAVDHSYIAIYIIPGANGTLSPGTRLINYVWYTHIPSSSLAPVMTDTHGRQHRHTLPIGLMRPEIWSTQQTLASKILPAPLAELIHKTTQPFASAIVDITVAKPVVFNGKLLFVGDALCAFRPHVASSMDQAAFDALMIKKLVKGEMRLDQWEAKVRGFAETTRLKSITWGHWYLGGPLGFGVSWLRYWLAEKWFHWVTPWG